MSLPRHSSLAARLALALAVSLGGAALAAPPAAAQTLNQLGVARLNQDAQALWAQDGLPMARRLAEQELQKLVGVPHQVVNSKTRAKIIAVHSVVLDCATAPGLTRLDGARIEGRLPLSGAWRIAVEARVNVKGEIAWIPFEDTFNVRLEVRNLSASIRADIDSSDPAAPRVTRVYPPQVAFNLRVDSANAVVQFVSFLTPGLLDPVANAAARAGAVYLAQKMSAIVSSTPQVIGAGGPAHPTVAPANLEAAVAKLEDQAWRWKMPYGTIFGMKFRDDYLGTWEQSLADPSFAPVPDEIEHYGDSTTNTGELMAGLAYRYAATRDAGTLARIRALVDTYDVLLHMKGTPGDLNRNILPLSAVPWRTLGATEYAITWNGVPHMASDYISRDAYFGTFFGLSHVHDLVGDPQVKAKAGALIEVALDYLLRNDWTWRKRDGSFGERWQGVLEQQYAWVLAAHRVNPSKYHAVREQYKGFADLVWVPFMIAVTDPHYSYFKFGLGGGSLHTLLRLETDPVRWQRAYQGFSIMRRFIGHHQNAYLNGFYFAADASSRAHLGAENRTLLTALLRQPRRKTRVDLKGDASIAQMPYTLPVDPNLIYPSGNQAPATIMIARYPIPVPKRITSGFAWSKSPFSLDHGHPAAPDARAEGESVDFVTPYWMSRYYGAIRAPLTGRPARRPRP
jgi:hypothetical protein